MTCTKKEIKTHNGLFKIGAVVLNENEIWYSEDYVEPVCAENDYVINFLPNGSKGIHKGRKHFSSIDDAETYICFLNVNGFSLMDL